MARCAKEKTQPRDGGLGPITALPQLCVDQIGKHLDLRSRLVLQLTSRGLFRKCIVAQRLLVVEATMVIYRNTGSPKWVIITDQGVLKHSHSAIMRTRFRVRAKELNIAYLSPEVHKHIMDCFSRGWTVETLVVNITAATVTPALFDELIQTLKVTNLHCRRARPSFFDLPSVKQLTSLWTSCPLPISFLFQSAVTTGTLRCRSTRQDSADMNRIIKMWYENKKTISKIKINGFQFRDDDIFNELEVHLIQSKPLYDTYSVERQDGAELFIRYNDVDRTIRLTDPEEDWQTDGWQLTEGRADDPSYEEHFL